MKTKKEKPNDLYWDMVQEQLENIHTWYLMFADKKPIMLYDIHEQKIYAYPYREFKMELNQESRKSLTDQYHRAIKKNLIVVFVRDNEKKKLVSYSVSIDKSK